MVNPYGVSLVFPEEMVETLVHEGSHHATAYTEDVEFQGQKVGNMIWASFFRRYLR